MASQYRLTGKLEGGELAELFRAQRDGAGSVVVKLFHENTSVKAYAKAIAETTNQLAGVQHPCISHVIDIGLVKRRLAIVREDGGRYTLGQVLQRLNTKEVVITSSLAMAMVIDLLEAVDAAHAAGVVHGAMTPGNVLLSGDGRPSVCDFGALAALSSVAALKKNFVNRGRSAYRAPELIKGDPLSIQSDVYSLGAMMYELLTLREASSESAQMSTRRDALPPPSRIDRRLNSRIDPIIMRALDPAPGRRYKSTAELAASLREFLTANGGLPSREELKRFVDQLFPNEVQLEPSPVVPFEGDFFLASVEGADIDIEAIEERSLVLTPRAAFSQSLDAMPVVGYEAETGPNDALTPPVYDPERERKTDWHAPQGAMPVTAKSGPKESLNPDVLKRMKRIEDFEGVPKAVEDTQPVGNRLETQLELPKVFPGKKEESATEPKAATVATPADSQPISLENSIVTPDGKRRRMITEEREIARAEAQRKKWIPLVVGSALAAFAFLLLGSWRWSSGEALQVYDGPRPSERPRPPLPKRAAPLAPQKIGDDRPRPPPVGDCYDTPKKGLVGYVTVSAPRPVAVLIDGDVVCGSLTRIPVATGLRKIVVIDTRTKEEYESPTRIEAGKQTRLIPIFKSK